MQGYPSVDRQLYLQNMQEINRLMETTAYKPDISNSPDAVVTNLVESVNTPPSKLSKVNNTQTTSLPPHDIRRVLSATQSKESNPPTLPTDLSDRMFESPDGHRYLRLNTHIRYSISSSTTHPTYEGSLVDCGANGGFAGADVRVLDHTLKRASVTGIEDHTVNDLPIGTVAGLVQTQQCPVILIMHQYAIYGKGKTIHSSPQLEFYGNEVCDKSRRVGGKQRITTLDGYVIPLQIRDGLPYFKMTPPTDEDLDIYPHVIVTSDNDWDPAILDNEIDIEQISHELDNLPPGQVVSLCS